MLKLNFGIRKVWRNIKKKHFKCKNIYKRKKKKKEKTGNSRGVKNTATERELLFINGLRNFTFWFSYLVSLTIIVFIFQCFISNRIQYTFLIYIHSGSQIFLANVIFLVWFKLYINEILLIKSLIIRICTL